MLRNAVPPHLLPVRMSPGNPIFASHINKIIMVLYRSVLASALCLSAGVSTFAQTAKPAATAHKPAAAVAAPALKTAQDSLSYAIGLSVAHFYKQENITNINTVLLTRAINDVTRSGKLLLDEQQANACIMNYVQKSK